MKNSGIIKWEVTISATITQKGKITKKDMQDLTKQIAGLNEQLGKIKNKWDSPTSISISPVGEKELKLITNFESKTPSPYALDFGSAGIMNIIKWFHVVIDDRDWDHTYITNVLRFKIKNTCDYIKNKQRHENWEQDVKYMEIALNLIDKIWPSEYTTVESYDTEWGSYHVSEHNFVDLDPEEEEKTIKAFGKDAKGSKRMEITEISENFDEFFSKNKLMHRKAIEHLKTNKGWSEPESKIVQAMVISKLKHEKAIKLLFRILENKLENWWD